MEMVYALPFPPRWQLKRELGHMFLNLGVARSALQIFEEQGMVEEIVRCYMVMEQPKKAENAIR